MAQGITGHLDYTGSKAGYRLRINYSETYDILTNSSQFKITSVQIMGTSYINRTFFPDGTIKINGTVVLSFNSSSGSARAVQSELNTWYDITEGGTAVSGGITVQHDVDGLASVTISIDRNRYSRLYFYTSNSSDAAYGWYVSPQTSAEIPLTAIPRTSTLSAQSGVLGEAQSLTINKAATSYRHNIRYACGSVQGTVVSDTADTVITFTPPLSLAEQNTSGETVDITYTLDSINNGVLIGSAVLTVTYSMPASIKPSVSPGWASVSAYNTGTKAENITALVQGYSKAQVDFDASKIEMSYGATITGYKLVFGSSEVSDAPYRTGIISSSGDMELTAYVYDSRGRYYSQTLTFTVYPYAVPTLSGIEIFRCSSSGVKDDAGTYLSVRVTGTFSAIGGQNVLSITAKYRTAAGSFGQAIALNSGQTAVIGGGLISISSSYVIQISGIDTLTNSAVYETVVPTASAAFHIRAGGTGAAFGKYNETPNTLELASGWSIKIGSTAINEAQLQALLNLL